MFKYICSTYCFPQRCLLYNSSHTHIFWKVFLDIFRNCIFDQNLLYLDKTLTKTILGPFCCSGFPWSVLSSFDNASDYTSVVLVRLSSRLCRALSPVCCVRSVDDERPSHGWSGGEADARGAPVRGADRGDDGHPRRRHDPQRHRHPAEYGLEGDPDPRQPRPVRHPGALHRQPVAAGLRRHGHAADGAEHAVERSSRRSTGRTTRTGGGRAYGRDSTTGRRWLAWAG